MYYSCIVGSKAIDKPVNILINLALLKMKKKHWSENVMF